MRRWTVDVLAAPVISARARTVGALPSRRSPSLTAAKTLRSLAEGSRVFVNGTADETAAGSEVSVPGVSVIMQSRYRAATTVSPSVAFWLRARSVGVKKTGHLIRSD